MFAPGFMAGDIVRCTPIRFFNPIHAFAVAFLIFGQRVFSP